MKRLLMVCLYLASSINLSAISTDQSVSLMGFYGDTNSLLWCLTPTEELNLWDLENVCCTGWFLKSIGSQSLDCHVEGRLKENTLWNVWPGNIQSYLLLLWPKAEFALPIRWYPEVCFSHVPLASNPSATYLTSLAEATWEFLVLKARKSRISQLWREAIQVWQPLVIGPTCLDTVKAACTLGQSIWTAGDDDVIYVWSKEGQSTVKRVCCTEIACFLD